MKWNKSMHAKLLQSCLTLCDPIDGGPLGSSVHRIFQTRILERVAISFSRNKSTNSEIKLCSLGEKKKKNHLLALYSCICKIKRQHLDFSRFKCDSKHTSNSKRPQTQPVGGNTGCGPYPWHRIQKSSQVVEVTVWQFPSLFHVSPHVLICRKTIDDTDAAGRGMERGHIHCASRGRVTRHRIARTGGGRWSSWRAPPLHKPRPFPSPSPPLPQPPCLQPITHPPPRVGPRTGLGPLRDDTSNSRHIVVNMSQFQWGEWTYSLLHRVE